MDDDARCTVGIDQFSDTNISLHERLVRLKAHVLPDGEGTSFTVKYLNKEEFKVYIPMEQIAMVFGEVKYAANAMLKRQSQTHDRGARKLKELADLSTSPKCMDVMTDPVNGDRLIVFQFGNQAPSVLRMSAEACRELSQKVANSYH